MIVRQLLHRDPVAVSYLFGCGGKGAVAVIDPVDPPDVYLRLASEAQTTIRAVIDTHVHADHRSTGRELSELAGAPYMLYANAGARYPFHGLHDGDRVELGNVVAEAWHVPGHTPEHLALVVTDRTRSTEPWIAFTGHTLMIGDMGRTELATDATTGAEALFDSAERLRALPDYVQVLPGAFAGSVCGRGLSATPISSIGFERRFNRSFSILDRNAFVRQMIQDLPAPPRDAARLRAENLGARAD